MNTHQCRVRSPGRLVRTFLILIAFLINGQLPGPVFADPFAVSPENIPAVIPQQPPQTIPNCPNNGIRPGFSHEQIAAGSWPMVAFNWQTYGRAQWGAMTVKKAGWYHVYDTAISESGADQRNEHGFLTIPNRLNPEGTPRWKNCGDNWIVADADNHVAPASLQYMGTFWLEAGENSVGITHLCSMIRAGFCGQFEVKDHPASLCSSTVMSPAANSIHFMGPSICLVETGPIVSPTPPSNYVNPIAFTENFESYQLGESPLRWLDTLSSGVERDFFRVAELAGEKALASTNTSAPAYSSYDTGRRGLWETMFWRNYEYTGRLRYTQTNGEVGVTFLNDFNDIPLFAELYGLRTDSARRPFHFWAEHQGARITGGTSNTGVWPSKNTWYRFKIQVEDTLKRTEFRAKVWVDGDPEPNGWQAEAFDDGLYRLSVGKVGLWTGQSNANTSYFDDLKVEPLTSQME